MDKASVLNDATKYVKQLQEKVKCLEDKNIESTFLIKRSRIITPTDDNSSSDDNFDRGASSESASQLEVKLSGRTVLVRIQCAKRKGVLARVLKEIEELNLTVSSTSAIPFTVSSLDITITAEGIYESSFNQQCEMTSESIIKAEQVTSSLGGVIKQVISSEVYNLNSSINSPRIPPSIEVPPMVPAEKSREVQKSISWIDSCTTDLNTTLKTTTSSTIIQFHNPPNINVVQEGRPSLEKEPSMFSRASDWTEQAINKEGLKTTQAQDHIIAERKRREKLSQRFIELSSVIPNLKKMDKASVHNDATKYVKQLQEKVKCLEDKNIESTFLIKRFRIITPTDDNFDRGASSESVSQLEVKLSGRTVLVRIQCEKRKGVLARVLKEIDELNLTVSSTSAILFTVSSLDITITAESDGELTITANDIVNTLSPAFNQFV